MKKQIIELLQSNPNANSTEILLLLQKKGMVCTTGYIRQIRRKLSVKSPPSLFDEIQEHRKITKSKKEVTETKKKLDFLLEKNERLEEQLESMKFIQGGTSSHVINPSYDSLKSEATAVVVASDWHLCETVIGSTVNNLNAYNEAIAKQRADDFFKNSLRLIKIFSQDIEIKQVVCGLLGDFINNMIHEEAQETNSKHPIHEVLFAQDILVAGINYWLENSKVSFTFVCHSGNHARSSVKQRHGIGDSGYSLEYMMYHSIAHRFAGNKRVNFVIPDSYHSYITIYDNVIRFHHGHDLRYQGGIGGLTIPVNKAIAQWNKAKKADYDVFGHFHQLFDGGNFICNGSMVGWNAYAVSIKASFEKPKQAMFLIDKKRGKTIVAPILFSV